MEDTRVSQELLKGFSNIGICLTGKESSFSVINKAQYRQDKRFSDAILFVCPNLTIRERLQVLYPSNPSNYYEKFDIVPRSMLDMLAKGKPLVTNWHPFLPVDDSRKRS